MRIMKSKRKAPKNPNKRPCVAKNITFEVQVENEYWIQVMKIKTQTVKEELF